MPASRVELMPNEQMVIHSNPHWWYFWKQFAEGIGVLVLGLLSLSFDGGLGTLFWWLTVIAGIGFVGHLIYEFLQWRSTDFAVTTKRVVYNSGLFHQQGTSIPLNRVNNVNFSQSMIAKLLKNGTLTIESAGDTGDSVFENIPNPTEVRTLIFSQIDADTAASSDRDAQAIAQAMGGRAPSGSPSATERLDQLEQLRSTGRLTDAEYEAKRQEILGDL
jgi:uncharacterized membrane protein YdbT with pleckstrin-like domain